MFPGTYVLLGLIMKVVKDTMHPNREFCERKNWRDILSSYLSVRNPLDQGLFMERQLQNVVYWNLMASFTLTANILQYREEKLTRNKTGSGTGV